MKVEDPDGFVDRQLFDFPPERDVYLGDLKIPIPADIPDLKEMFQACCMLRKMWSSCLSTHLLVDCQGFTCCMGGGGGGGQGGGLPP